MRIARSRIWGLALWKSQTNRNITAHVRGTVQGLALWKSQTNRNGGQDKGLDREV